MSFPEHRNFAGEKKKRNKCSLLRFYGLILKSSVMDDTTPANGS